MFLKTNPLCPQHSILLGTQVALLLAVMDLSSALRGLPSAFRVCGGVLGRHSLFRLPLRRARGGVVLSAPMWLDGPHRLLSSFKQNISPNSATIS